MQRRSRPPGRRLCSRLASCGPATPYQAADAVATVSSSSPARTLWSHLHRARPMPLPSPSPGVPPALDVRGLAHSFGAARVLDAVDLSLGAGEFCVLLG